MAHVTFLIKRPISSSAGSPLDDREFFVGPDRVPPHSAILDESEDVAIYGNHACPAGRGSAIGAGGGHCVAAGEFGSGLGRVGVPGRMAGSP